MNHRERVFASIKRQTPDRIPFGELIVPDGLVRRFLGVKVWDEETRLFRKKEFLQQLGMDLVVVNAASRSEGDEGNMNPSLAGEVEFWATQTDLFIFVLFEGGFTRAFHRFGGQNFFRVLARSPWDVVPAIEGTCRSLESTAVEVLQVGADGIIIGDDIAYRKGLLVNPELLREMLWKPLSETINRIKGEKQCPVFFHSEGNIWRALPDIVAAGFDGVHSLEPSSGMDIKEVRRVFDDKICLMGNLELEYLISRDETEMFREVINILQAAGDGSGFIFSTTGGLIDEVDVVKLRKMCEIIVNWQPKR